MTNSHDNVLLNEYKIKLEADLLELEFLDFNPFDRLEFLEKLRHMVLYKTVQLEKELNI
jgi:hypothetical protein